jgi:hypothetical protein
LEIKSLPQADAVQHSDALIIRASKIVVTVEPVRSSLSLNQLACLWGVVYPSIASHTGHTATEIHEISKRLLLPPRITKFRGREIKMAGTTTALSEGEMAEFITRVIAEAADMGINVPPASLDHQSR